MASVISFMFSRGLRTRILDLGYFATRSGVLVRSLLSVDILAPMIALVIVMLIRPASPTAIGLLILASSPAAPLVLKKIARAGGNPEYAVSLHLVLASFAALTTPVTLSLLSGVTGVRQEIHPLAVAGQVGASILVPIIAGIIIRWLFPALAEHAAGPLENLSNITLVLAVILVLLFTYHQLWMLDIRSYVTIALTIAGALIAGHLMAAGRQEEQTTLALESATRNVGLALLIASTFAPLANALPVLVPYLLTSAAIGLIYVRYQKSALRRSSPRP